MKKLNVLLFVVSCILFSTVLAYGAFVVTLTDMCMENIQIYRQDVEDQGMQVFMAMNYTLYNSGGDTKGRNIIFTLTTQQRTQIVNFIKPFVVYKTSQAVCRSLVLHFLEHLYIANRRTNQLAEQPY